jgi:DNA-binding response OmpR family regulator
MKIGVVEDDPDQLTLMDWWLRGAHHSVQSYPSAEQAMGALSATSPHERPDLLLVDWRLPNLSGAQLLDWVRTNLGWEVPILVVTACDDEATVVAALRAGADDYVVKPPKRLELLARITALARRAGSATGDAAAAGAQGVRAGRGTIEAVQHVDDFTIDLQRQLVLFQGDAIPLTQKEFDLAAYLFQSPGKLLSRDHLLNKIWGIHAELDTRTVDTHISRLRRKLGFDGRRGWKLVPVYGVGYRFDRLGLET